MRFALLRVLDWEVGMKLKGGRKGWKKPRDREIHKPNV